MQLHQVILRWALQKGYSIIPGEHTYPRMRASGTIDTAQTGGPDWKFMLGGRGAAVSSEGVRAHIANTILSFRLVVNLGSGNPTHQLENLGIYGLELSKTEMEQIDGLRDDPSYMYAGKKDAV